MTNSRASKNYATMIIKSDETVNNSTTLVNTALTLPVNANTIYHLRYTLIIKSTAVADFKFTTTVPSGTVAVAITGPHSGLVPAATTTVLAANCPTDGGKQILTISMSISTSSTAGNLTFQFAQLTGEVSNTNLYIGSLMELFK